MTVQELINELQNFNLDSEIRFAGIIESGRGVSWVDVEDCLLEEEDGQVILSVTGDVDEDGGYN